MNFSRKHLAVFSMVSFLAAASVPVAFAKHECTKCKHEAGKECDCKDHECKDGKCAHDHKADATKKH